MRVIFMPALVDPSIVGQLGMLAKLSLATFVSCLTGRELVVLEAESNDDDARRACGGARRDRQGVQQQDSLGAAYLTAVRPTLEHQLPVAGLRLARLLNEKFP
jgi:hypothetical protein